jgi:ELWxxDGT repeat protein
MKRVLIIQILILPITIFSITCSYGNRKKGSDNPGPVYTLVDNYFFAVDIYGDESDIALYISDGTTAGTLMLKSGFSTLPFGNSRAISDGYIEFTDDTVFFKGCDETNGCEFWKSDGTPEGTVIVKDIFPGGWDSDPKYITEMGNSVYFAADNGANGNELWKSDGTPEGTVIVKDIFTSTIGTKYSWPKNLTRGGNTLYFTANTATDSNKLWKSDGTETGTVMVQGIADDGATLACHFIEMNNMVYFQATNNSDGSELWKSDGTGAGTVMIKDINTTNASAPEGFLAIDNTLYFRANDGSSGIELWKSDGTEAGTVMVKDIYAGLDNSRPEYFAAMGNTLYFRADNGTNGRELWKSDGTEAGTVMVKDIYAGLGNSQPGRFCCNRQYTLF